MRSRSARVVSAFVAWIVLGLAGFFVFQSHQETRSAAAALREADLHAREAADALVDLRIAQQAYVAAGQGVDFWMPKVVSTKAQVAAALTALRGSISSPAARTELDEAVAAMGEFDGVDKRARDYIRSRQVLMAGDVIFTEGGQLATVAARKVELTRLAEHQAVDANEAALWSRQASVMGAAGVVAGLIALVLAVTGRSAAAEQPGIAQLGLSGGASEAIRPAPWSQKPLDTDEGVVAHARAAASVSNATPKQAGGAVAMDVPPPPRNAIVLKTAADLATDFGRVRESEELQRLLGRTADLLDAAGVVVWMSAMDSGGESLRPVLSHGYTPQILARMSAVPCSADNAAAAAYRTGTLQVVQSRVRGAAGAPGSSGAIVAPILAADGCIGALSAEINNGGEGSEAVQAIAAIVAAQLAGILAATSVESAADADAAMRTAHRQLGPLPDGYAGRPRIVRRCDSILRLQ